MEEKFNPDLHSRAIVALDVSLPDALRIAGDLQGLAGWVKVGMTLYYNAGPTVVSQLKELGYRVFVDLKLFDIPSQVEGAASYLTTGGADMFTVHAAGGYKMLEQALNGAGLAASGDQRDMPLILGVTVLTSMDEAVMQSVGVKGPVDQQVLRLAELAVQAGLGGIVASPRELAMLRAAVGSETVIVTPGVRPVGADSNDQSRTATPLEALSNGADYIVVGRPVTAAVNPREAFLALFDE